MDQIKLTPPYQPKNPQAYEPYVPAPQLIQAVNLAIYLGRPLLLQGEPGCGKTRLARYVVQSLYGEKYGDDYKKFYREWFVKSTSKAREGLYTYDHIARLRDAQLSGKDPNIKDISPEKYVKYGALGEAFMEKKERCVVLIDEIDKADIDFQNDLLLELDEQRFFVAELEKDNFISAQHKPIVIITSNNEKTLSSAFLRRCIYFYISFPEKEQLYRILESHFPEADPALRTAAVDKFHDLRQKLKNPVKNPDTSELIDWFKAILLHPEKFSPEPDADIPFENIFLKSMEAIEAFQQLKKNTFKVKS